MHNPPSRVVQEEMFVQTVLWSNFDATILFSSPHTFFWTRLLQAGRHFSASSDRVNKPRLSRISARLFPAHLYTNIGMASKNNMEELRIQSKQGALMPFIAGRLVSTLP